MGGKSKNIEKKRGNEGKALFLPQKGLFDPTFMFFVLMNPPATFQMMMNTIFHKQVAQGWLSVYMDDLCNWPRVNVALVSGATGQYDETFTLSLTHSCMISFRAALCSLMTSSYQCCCLVSPIPFCVGVICSLARSMLDLSLDTYLHHHSQLPCTSLQ